jgi:hypothetical protein
MVAGDGQLFFQGSRVTLPELANKFDEAARNTEDAEGTPNANLTADPR